MYTAEHAAYSIPRKLLTGEFRCSSCDWRQRCGMGMLLRGYDTTVKRVERTLLLCVLPGKIPLLCAFKVKDHAVKCIARVPILGSCTGIMNMLKPHNLPTLPILLWVRFCPLYRVMSLLAPANFVRPKFWSFKSYD